MRFGGNPPANPGPDGLPTIGTVAAITAQIAATLEAGDRAHAEQPVGSPEFYVRRAKELIDAATKSYEAPPR